MRGIRARSDLTMQANLKIEHDTLTPELEKMLKRIRDPRPVMEAYALGFAALGQRAWRDASLRPRPWPARRDGGTATLYKRGTLARSLRVAGVTNTRAQVVSDRPYAAIHQFGGRTPARTIVAAYKKALFWPGARHPVKSVRHPGSNIPARPFLPAHPDGRFTTAAETRMRSVLQAAIMAHLKR